MPENHEMLSICQVEKEFSQSLDIEHWPRPKERQVKGIAQ